MNDTPEHARPRSSRAKSRKVLHGRAASDLLTFARSIQIPGVPFAPDRGAESACAADARFGRHHLVWLDRLQRVENGEIKRLLGLMPPGSAKSTYTSVVFPAHVMGRVPGAQLLVASYGSLLPRKFGRRARGIVRQQIYREIFDAALSNESAAADQFALTNGSEYMGAGILAGITGNRADGIVWDDLIKGREQADSKAIRDKTWEAYTDDLLTRKKPGAFEIGITTRWHEDDVAGRILPEGYNGESGDIACRDGNTWHVVCIPAEAERADDVLGRGLGERIWPEHFGEDHFTPFKVHARTWAALYQQRPSPEEGDYFRADWLRVVERLPPNLRTWGASDYAVSAGRGDYTVHVVVGLDPQGRMYLLDLWRRQSAPDEWIEAFCDLVEKWKPIGWAEESGQIASGIGPFLEKRMRERRARVYRQPFVARLNKAVRAQSIRGRMALDGLYVPACAPWLADFRAELLAFPTGRHDDQVDAIGLIGQLLDRMVPPAGAKPAAPRRDRWDGAGDEGGSWKAV
jgi:predicted phage terminase large subunit-like protein